MTTIRYELADGIATLTFDEPGSPVNTMCARWQADLDRVTARVVEEQEAIRGIVLASAKTTFFAGADLKGLMRHTAADASAVFREIEKMKKNFRTLETLGKPVVSCINGAALGGGWEVALIGHYRVAVDDPKIQLGLPEITLGLIPGASGITKMTRLLGLMGAQPYILESKLFNPREALDLGLVHALVADAAALRPAALAWIEANPKAGHPWDDKNHKIPGGTPSSPRIAAALSVAPAMMRKTSRGLYPAPEAALCAMVEGAQVDFDTALRIESRYLARLAVSPVARNMINTFFFDMNAIRSGQSRPAGVPRYKPGKVVLPGEVPHTVHDAHDDFTSRTSNVYVMEGAAMMDEGIAPAIIENAGLQAGMPVGPLAVLDETALSLSVHVMDQTRADLTAEGKSYTPTRGEQLVERMVKEFGRPGRAGGGGFYDYPAGGKKSLWSGLKQFEKTGTPPPMQDLVDRLLYRQAIETARCLHEGVLTTVHDANIGSIFGIGFPAWTGGALQFIYGMGIAAFTTRAAELAARYGQGFEVTEAVKATVTKYQPRY